MRTLCLLCARRVLGRPGLRPLQALAPQLCLRLGRLAGLSHLLELWKAGWCGGDRGSKGWDVANSLASLAF